MCGIAGQLKFQSPADQQLVKRMTQVLAHRGPDGEGFYFNGPIGLGMRRLKIIDLVTGDQPIHNQAKTVWVVFNGEIYNYKTLRNELASKGYQFYTQSDTEVIVHLYDEYGENFIEHLNGMFGLALWDGKEQKLVIARDRAGEKPVYFYQDKEQFLFASELKAILESAEIKREVDPVALHYYLVYGRVPAPFGIIKNVRKLEPGQLLVVKDQKIKISEYWRLSFKEKFNLPEEEIKKLFLAQLEQSVASRLVADVPLGAFLSGGVDSSAVVAMMAKHSAKPVETFAVGFAEEDFSELRYARIIANKFGTHHHEFIIKPEVLEILPKLVWHLDEPFADASIIPTYYVAKTARDFVTVALTGDGGDELFAGYEWYKALKLARLYQCSPLFIRKFIYKISQAIPETDERESFIRYFHKIKRLAETQLVSFKKPLDIFLNMTTGFTEEILHQEVYQNSPLAAGAKALRQKLVDEYDGTDPLEAILYSQFKSLLPDMFFTKVDRCTMAVALESRAPLVDHLLVELIAKIPFKYKLHGFKTKYLFKEALRGILPEEIIFRHKKGFTIPLNRWIKEGQLKDEVRNTLLDKSFASLGYFKEEYIKKILTEHNTNQKNNFDKIWRLYMFALWHKTFIK